MPWLVFVALLLLMQSAAAQYWGWQQQPYQQRYVPTHPSHVMAPHQHHPRHSMHHQRSAAEWKRSIQAQGKQFCAANPRDPICHH